MLTAFVKNSLIEMVKDVTDEEYSVLAPPFECAIDISNMTPTPEVGWKWNGQAFESNGVVAGSSKKITKLALRNRFTREEKVILENALAVSAEMKAWYRDYDAATFIDLARTDTIEGIGYLEYAGLIASGRANEILNNPITAEERWY
jgi:hypothetical protein